jgi:regulator of extracellular matrix RemA (YlzA/DUF370 family)
LRPILIRLPSGNWIAPHRVVSIISDVKFETKQPIVVCRTGDDDVIAAYGKTDKDMPALIAKVAQIITEAVMEQHEGSK